MLILNSAKVRKERKEEVRQEKVRKEHNLHFSNHRIDGFKFAGSLQIRSGKEG